MADIARRQRDFMDIVLIALTVLVLLAAFAVVLAAVYPEATQNIASAISNGTS